MVSENLVRWTLRFSVVYNLFGAATFAFPAVLGTTAGLPVAAPMTTAQGVKDVVPQ